MCDGVGKHLSDEEREKLNEKKADGSNVFMRTNENVKFSLKKLADAFGFTFRLKYGKEWCRFLRVAKKRNRLTHPKTKADLKITITEHNESAETLDWFNRTIKEFFDELRKARGITVYIS